MEYGGGFCASAEQGVNVMLRKRNHVRVGLGLPLNNI